MSTQKFENVQNMRIKHQKTLRAINRANHKQAQSLAKRAKRLDCKLTLSIVFVSKNSIVI